MKTTAYILFLILLLLPASLLMAAAEFPQENYQAIEDLEESWQVYDTDYKSYIPYLERVHGNVEALHLELNLNNYKGYHLRIQTTRPVYLFVQAQLNRKLADGQIIVLNIDSLKRIYTQPTVLFSFYNQLGHSVKPSVSIINYIERSSGSNLQEASVLPLKPREQSGLEDFAIIAAILITALFAFLWNYHPNAFRSYYNLKPLFSLNIKEDTVLVSRPLSRISMLFILNHSLLLSFLYILIQKSSGKPLLNDRILQTASTFSELFYYFSLLSISLFILIIAKYFFLYLLGNLFNLSNVIHVHFYKYLLFSRLFYSLIVPILFVIYLSFPLAISTASQQVIYIIIAFNFIRLVIINFALNKLTSVKNLYLFSYLCATELTPLLIGIKVLVA
jgi:hypothetical protein